MREDDSRPGEVDPTGSTHALRAALRAALAARTRLEGQTVSDQDLEVIQRVLRDQVLPALANEDLWRALAELERDQARAAAERPGLAGQQASTLLSTFVGELLGDANRQSPDAVLHGGLWTPQHDTIAGGAHLHVQVFNITVGPLVDQPVPPADDPGRRDWVQGIKAVLDKAVDMLLNLAVAAAFTVTAVQLAAEHAVTETAEAAGRALEYAGQAWPSLVAVGAVALQAAVGVSVAKQAWDSVRSARAEAAAAARFDDRDCVVSPSHREHEAPDPASQPQRPADQDWGAADPREVSQTSVYGESPRLRRVDDRQPVDDQVASDRQQVSRTTPLGGQPYERLAQEPDQTGTATPPVPVREGHTRRTRLDAGNDHGDMDEFQEFTSEQRPPSSPRTVASIDSVSRSEPAAPSKPGVVSGPGNRSQLPQRVVRPGDADGRPANHQAHSRSMNMGPSPKQTLPQSAIDKELGSDESHRERGSGGAPSAR